MKTKSWKLVLIASLGAFMISSCAVYVHPPAGEVVVSDAPPGPQVDVVTASPGPDFVWIGGAWVVGPGGGWVWEGGRWERPPHPGAHWVPHSYVVRNGRRVFVRGGWR